MSAKLNLKNIFEDECSKHQVQLMGVLCRKLLNSAVALITKGTSTENATHSIMIRSHAGTILQILQEVDCQKNGGTSVFLPTSTQVTYKSFLSLIKKPHDFPNVCSESFLQILPCAFLNICVQKNWFYYGSAVN